MGTVYDVLVLLVLGFELFLGFLDGFWVRFLRLLGLIISMVASVVLTGPLCQWLFSVLPINSIKFGLFCWLVLFILIAAIAWVLVHCVEVLHDKKKGGAFLSPTSHVCGAFVGGLHGVLLVLVVTWGYGMLRVNFVPSAPSFATARLMPVVERVAEASAFAAIYPSVGPEALARRVAWQLGHPGRTMDLWQKLLLQNSFIGLLDSDSFWQGVLAGDELVILANESFQDLLHDKVALRALRLLVLPVRDYEQLEERRVLAEQLAMLGRAYGRIQDQDKVQSVVATLMEDRRFERGARAELVGDMRFIRLVAKVICEESTVAENE